MDDIFKNLTPEQLEALSARVSPETAQALQSNMSQSQQVQLSPLEQLSAESQGYSVPATPMQEQPVSSLQQADDVRNQTLQQDLGLDSAQKIGTYQDNLRALQDEQDMLEAGIKNKYAQTEEQNAEQQRAVAEQQELDAARQISEHKKKLELEEAKLAIDRQKELQRQRKLEMLMQQKNKLETDAKKETDEEENPFQKNKFLTALFVGLSGYGAARLGRENDALKIIQSKLDEIATNKKLKQEEILAKQKAELDRAQLEIQKRTLNINEKETNARVAQILNDIDVKRKELDIKLNGSLNKSRSNISATEALGLDKDTAEKYVGVDMKNSQTGLNEVRYFPTLSKWNKEKVTERLNEMNSANSLITSLEQINNEVSLLDYATDKVGLSTLGKEANAISEQLVGKLRLELFGPGVMTDTERNAAKAILASPMTAFAQFNKEGNQHLLATIKYRFADNMRQELRRAGAQIPKSINESNVDGYIAANAKKGIKLTTSQAIKHLMNSGTWLAEDFIPSDE